MNTNDKKCMQPFKSYCEKCGENKGLHNTCNPPVEDKREHHIIDVFEKMHGKEPQNQDWVKGFEDINERYKGFFTGVDEYANAFPKMESCIVCGITFGDYKEIIHALEDHVTHLLLETEQRVKRELA